jgi:hypothetical protein
MIRISPRRALVIGGAALGSAVLGGGIFLAVSGGNGYYAAKAAHADAGKVGTALSNFYSCSTTARGLTVPSGTLVLGTPVGPCTSPDGKHTAGSRQQAGAYAGDWMDALEVDTKELYADVSDINHAAILRDNVQDPYSDLLMSADESSFYPLFGKLDADLTITKTNIDKAYHRLYLRRLAATHG